MLVDELTQVYITALEGLGSSYRMKGYFTLEMSGTSVKIPFEGVAFGGNYGGHNVNVNITDDDKRSIIENKKVSGDDEVEDLLSEVQRRLLNNEMIVEYANIKPETPQGLDGLGGI